MTKNTGKPAFAWQLERNRDGFAVTGGMTLRQYAAIKLKVPDSGTDWLDDMICKSLQDDFAAKAMQGCIAGWPLNSMPPAKETALAAYQYADEMLKAREA